MLINKKIIEELYYDAGEERIQKARLYTKTGRVEIEKINYNDKNNFELTGNVSGQENYRTHISVESGEIIDVTCECKDYQKRYASCKHIVATMMEFESNDKYMSMIEKSDTVDFHKTLRTDSKYRNFKQIVNEFYAEEMQEIEESNEHEREEIYPEIKIEPKIIYDKYESNLRVEFKIGNQRMYKIKNLAEFYDRMINKEKYKYGSKLEFIHKKEVFVDNSQEILQFILKHSEIIRFVNSSVNTSYRYYGKALNEGYILLNNSGIDEIFEILKGQEISFQKEYKDEKIELKNENPDLHFVMKKRGKEEYQIVLNKKIDIMRDIDIIIGKEYKYLLIDNVLYRCDKKYEQTTFKLLKMLKDNFMTELIFGKEQLPELFSIILLKLKNSIEFKGIDEQQIEQYKPKKLVVKLFLDYDKNEHILADAKFCYGEEEFNPLQQKIKIKYPRDVVAENKALNLLRKTGFMYYAQKECFILPDEDKIYNFLLNDVNEYMQKFEVMVTDEFKSKQIKQPKIGNLGIKVENNLLTIDLTNLNIDISELKEIMAKYELKKKYHKLKDGTFINLEENQDIEFIDKLVTGMDIEFKELENGPVKLPVNRSLYLNQLLKTINNTPITKNDEYKKIINGLEKDSDETDIEIPASLDSVLRYYQKTGYKWLKTLDNYKFGGILADDMGLGKTIQMLSIIAGYIDENKEEKRASIVICPSSLTLNWQNESQKFTNKLKTIVIRGNSQERKEQIKNIGKYDLIITSYDLLKRDIEFYKEIKYAFRFAITDEAQYLKNSNTQNAKAVKEIVADTRYALTGTPIENSLAELWSIFDYIMPGYLFAYKKFKTEFEVPIVKEENQNAMKKL